MYYTGLLAGRNDMELLERSGVGRDINRHYYTDTEILSALDSPLVKAILQLLRLRMTHPAFDGEFQLLDLPDTLLGLRWQQTSSSIALIVDLERHTATIHASDTNSNSQQRVSVEKPPS